MVEFREAKSGTRYEVINPADESVVATSLRVRGPHNLRVMDCSIMPTMVSGNLNGPAMAMAWRAADLILDTQ